MESFRELFDPLEVIIALSNRESMGRHSGVGEGKLESGNVVSEGVCIGTLTRSFASAGSCFMLGTTWYCVRMAASSFSSWATLSLRFILVCDAGMGSHSA
jgi:hypothetical protein